MSVNYPVAQHPVSDTAESMKALHIGPASGPLALNLYVNLVHTTKLKNKAYHFPLYRWSPGPTQSLCRTLKKAVLGNSSTSFPPLHILEVRLWKATPERPSQAHPPWRSDPEVAATFFVFVYTGDIQKSGVLQAEGRRSDPLWELTMQQNLQFCHLLDCFAVGTFLGAPGFKNNVMNSLVDLRAAIIWTHRIDTCSYNWVYLASRNRTYLAIQKHT